MSRANNPLLISLTTLLIASACLTTLSAPAAVPATPTPDLAMTGKAQTLTAAPAATFTITPVPPTNPPTNTLTPFPSITPLPSATSTPTKTPFGYFETTTPLPAGSATVETPDPAEGASNGYGSDYACKLADKSPSDWEILPARSTYKVSWKLFNIGRKTWDNNVIIVWVDGPKIGTEKKFTFIKDVKTGQDAKAVITIFTPDLPGHYRSVWGLRSVKTDEVFCTFTVKFILQ
jgi:hypothetical protein